MELTKCLNCEKEVTQNKGKRTKLYCSDLCRATYYQKKKAEKPEKYLIELPKDYMNVNKIMVLKEDGTLAPIEDFPKTDNFELWMTAYKALEQVIDDEGKQRFFEFKPTMEDVGIVGSEIISPVAGKTVTVTLKADDHFVNPNQSLITQYEQELSTLGDGQFAKARKKWLQNKIKELKTQPNNNTQ